MSDEVSAVMASHKISIHQYSVQRIQISTATHYSILVIFIFTLITSTNTATILFSSTNNATVFQYLKANVIFYIRLLYVGVYNENIIQCFVE
jgi:hypothetical protein